eukprot:2737301-Pyramimonas_sp.AAC.1
MQQHARVFEPRLNHKRILNREGDRGRQKTTVVVCHPPSRVSRTGVVDGMRGVVGGMQGVVG